MSYYNGTNMSLQYDPSDLENPWKLQNVAQKFIDLNVFKTQDASFPYTPTEEDTEDTETPTPTCPPGYIYNSTLKQCVPDPNFQTDFLGEPMQQPGGQSGEIGVYIPSNATKENWIKNADTIIPQGQEGAGKTGFQNYIENLQDRGWLKSEDGKLIFKTQNLGNVIGSSMLERFGMGDLPKQKTNKIIQDLQQMGAVNAQITMDEKGNIKFADELELANKPYQFATYDLSGKFTTPAASSVGSQTFNTWEDYMNALSEVKTSVASPVKSTLIKKEQKEKEQEIIENLKKEQAQQQAQQQAQEQAQQDYQNTGTTTYSTSQTGGYVTTPNLPAAPPGEAGGGGFVSPPSNTSPIGGTGQTYAQFKER
jgi:hypothetical protein